MTVELISVGTELLLGNIVNTNANYLSVQCAQLGLSMYHQVTIGDNESRLIEAISTALKRSDIVILTGGLGPTTDDITKESVAKVLNRKLLWTSSPVREFSPILKESRQIIRRFPRIYLQSLIITGSRP